MAAELGGEYGNGAEHRKAAVESAKGVFFTRPFDYSALRVGLEEKLMSVRIGLLRRVRRRGWSGTRIRRIFSRRLL